MSNIKQIVFENLQNAKENGAFGRGGYLDSASAAEIADDMIALAADCETYSANELLPHVEAWLEGNR